MPIGPTGAASSILLESESPQRLEHFASSRARLPSGTHAAPIHLAAPLIRPVGEFPGSGTGTALQRRIHTCPARFREWTRTSKTPNSGPRSSTSYSRASIRFCFPAWSIATVARVGTRTYVSEMPLFTSIIREQYTEEFIEIRNRTDGKLITLLEVVSPANKTTPAGRASVPRRAYHRHRPKGRHRRNRPGDAGQTNPYLLP